MAIVSFRLLTSSINLGLLFSATTLAMIIRRSCSVTGVGRLPFFECERPHLCLHLHFELRYRSRAPNRVQSKGQIALRREKLCRKRGWYVQAEWLHFLVASSLSRAAAQSSRILIPLLPIVIPCATSSARLKGCPSILSKSRSSVPKASRMMVGCCDLIRREPFEAVR